MKEQWRKGFLAIFASVAVMGGTIRVALDYRNNTAFRSTDSKSKMNNNQVLFANGDSATGTGDTDNTDNSFWENKDADSNASQPNNGAGYLFKDGKTAAIENNQAKADTATRPGGDATNTVIDVAGDLDKIDTVIKGRPSTGTNTVLPSQNNPTNQGGSSDEDGSFTPTPNPSPTPTPTPDPEQPNYAASAKDPASSKNQPSSGTLPTEKYHENVIPATPSTSTGENESVYIGQPLLSAQYYLYLGQQLNTTTLFNALETYVRGADDTIYLWGSDALDRYIRLDSVSFDEGNTWVALPTTIPNSLPDNTMLIKAAYRLSTKDTWTEQIVSYYVESNRILLLNKKLTQENEVIGKDILLNSDAFYQYHEPGSMLNLLYFQQEMLGKERLTKLFPGWTENGKLVPWYYIATTGRHILEPADMVDLDSRYGVEVTLKWLNDNYEEDWENGRLSYLQTLVEYEKNSVDRLDVPMYIQVVNFQSPITVNEISIPDTVWYINTSSGMLNVQNGYVVSENNTVYRADRGILLNKAGTAVLGIPHNYTSITIPSGVNQITLAADNQLRRITLQATSLEDIPTFNYENLSANCLLVVDDNIWEDFLLAHRDLFSKKGIYVAKASDSTVGYTVRGDAIISKDGVVKKVLRTAGEATYLPSEASRIAAGALDDCKNTTILVLPESNKTILFDDNCFTNSTIDTVFCYSTDQFDQAVSSVPTQISVMMLRTSAEGYVFYSISHNDRLDNVIVSVPREITEFDGIVTDESGAAVDITALADRSFANKDQLQWVTLPESIKQIGRSAFEGCTKLEGVLIQSTDSIVIGYNAFENCSELRFVASNAINGVMQDGYSFRVTDGYEDQTTFLFAPSNCIGYNGNWLSFLEAAGIDRFEVMNVGTSRMLYGVSDDRGAWLLLRSGKTVDPALVFPDTTYEIWKYALSDTISTEGSYTVSLDNLTGVFIDDGVFAGSELSGHLTLPVLGSLGASVFLNCRQLEEVTFGTFLWDNSLYAGTFTGCDALHDITFTSYTPPTAVIEYYTKFQFNLQWSYAEECENLQIHVPEYTEIEYIKAWRFPAAGYPGSVYESPYQQLWSMIKMRNTDPETLEAPDDDTIDMMLEQELVVEENRLRALLRMDPVDTPTELYHFRVSADGYITLTKATPDITVASLYDTDIGLVSGWALDYIASGAFSRCKNLDTVLLPENLVGISDGAFSGVESDTLSIMGSTSIPALIDFTPGVPFSFGVDDSKITLLLWSGENDYIREWLFPMAGYRDLAEMKQLVADELAETFGDKLTDDMVNQTIIQRLLVAENRIRSMIEGMDTISDPSEMVGVSIDEQGNIIEPEEPEEPEEPDLPDLPDWPEWPDEGEWTNVYSNPATNINSRRNEQE